MKTFALQMEEFEEQKQGLDQHGTKKMNIVCVYVYTCTGGCMSSSVLGIICDFYLFSESFLWSFADP